MKTEQYFMNQHLMKDSAYQATYCKQQWVTQWKQNIGTSILRATKDTTSATKESYKYFNRNTLLKTKINKGHLQARKRTYQHKRASMLLGCKLYTFTGVTKCTTKLTSKKPPELIQSRMSNTLLALLSSSLIPREQSKHNW